MEPEGAVFILPTKIKILKESELHPAQKVGKKAYMINNNRLVENHSTGQVEEIEKGKESVKGRSVILTQSQARDTYIWTSTPGINSQITKK